MLSDKYSEGSAIFNPVPGHRSAHYLKHCNITWDFEVNKDIPEAARILNGPHTNWDDNVIWLYTTSYYAGVNTALYTDTEADLIKYGGYIGELRRVLRQRCRQSNYMRGTVYRGMSLSQDIIDQLKPGFKFLFPNFLSTSRRRSSAFSGNVRLNIELYKKVSLTFALHVAGLSAFPQEDEVLFYPYSGFEVLETSVVGCQTTVRMRPYSTLLMEGTHPKITFKGNGVVVKGKGKGKGKGKNKSKGSGNCSGAKSDSAAEDASEAQQKTNWYFSKGAIEDSVKDSVEDLVEGSVEDKVKQGKDVAKGLMEESFKEKQNGTETYSSADCADSADVSLGTSCLTIVHTTQSLEAPDSEKLTWAKTLFGASV